MLLTCRLAAAGPALAEEAATALAGRWTVGTLAGDQPATPAGDITFDANRKAIAGATACNFFQGDYETSGGAELKINVGMMTRRACAGPAGEHERVLLEALASTRGYRIDADRLTLTGTGGAVLAELTRAQNAQLEGPSHKIVSYYWNGGLYSAKQETTPVISFKDGSISGSTGCRPFSARYSRDGERFTVTDLQPAKTLAPCAGNVGDQDIAILAALPRVTTFDTSRNLIRLLESPGGAAMMWITPQVP
jgi:heat shock protein HslJ